MLVGGSDDATAAHQQDGVNLKLVIALMLICGAVWIRKQGASLGTWAVQYVGRRSQLQVREGAFEWPTIKATVEQVIWDLDEGDLATVSPLEVRERVEHVLGLERGDLQSFRRDIMSLAAETASQWHTHHGLDAASTSSKQD